MSEDINPAFAAARDQIRWFAIGFVLLSVSDSVEQGDSGGSGTLATINGVKGILTAAHVARTLFNHSGEVGIVRFHGSQTHLQKTKLLMDKVHPTQLGNPPWTCDGPDLAFLTLPPDVGGSLAATNSFYDLSAKRHAALNADFPTGKSFSCVAGVVNERTTDVPVRDKTPRKKLFEALCEPGNVSDLRTVDGFDLLDFDAKPHDDGQSPTSYEGVSGAALWRVYCDVNSEGVPLRLNKLWLHGVAFYQKFHRERVPTIRCHGPLSVFDKLLSKFERRGTSVNQHD